MTSIDPARRETTPACGAKRSQSTDFSKRMALAASVCLAIALHAAPVAAQQSAGELVATHQQWGAFVAEVGGVRSCYAATVPTATETSQSVTSRGEPYLLVSTFPSQNVAEEVSVLLGFEADNSQPITLTVDDGEAFQMFGDGRHAFLASSEQNEAVVTALRRGRAAVVVATSSARGTVITDTYSLIGVTAALNSASENCE